MRKVSSLFRQLLARFSRKPDAAPPASSPESGAEEKTPEKRGPLFLALLLGGLALGGATLLAGGFAVTESAIRQRHKEDLLASLSLVVPAGLHDNDLAADGYDLAIEGSKPLKVYPAKRDGSITAVAYQVLGQGYGGAIVILMGVQADGRILGMHMLQHAETPGLGDKIEEKKGDWILSFNGLSLGDPASEKWAVRKDGGRFDQFSGATITPRAVVKAVRDGLQFFADNRTRLLTPAKEPSR
jgi:electron transport complex protein RnfG